ncbi:MAG TPA: hypothetical protein VGO93_07730 [Candidatus Xenobia bacterium]|jgi:hypothetical protein
MNIEPEDDIEREDYFERRDLLPAPASHEQKTWSHREVLREKAMLVLLKLKPEWTREFASIGRAQIGQTVSEQQIADVVTAYLNSLNLLDRLPTWGIRKLAACLAGWRTMGAEQDENGLVQWIEARLADVKPRLRADLESLQHEWQTDPTYRVRVTAVWDPSTQDRKAVKRDIKKQFEQQLEAELDRIQRYHRALLGAEPADPENREKIGKGKLPDSPYRDLEWVILRQIDLLSWEKIGERYSPRKHGGRTGSKVDAGNVYNRVHKLVTALQDWAHATVGEDKFHPA